MASRPTPPTDPPGGERREAERPTKSKGPDHEQAAQNDTRSRRSVPTSPLIRSQLLNRSHRPKAATMVGMARKNAELRRRPLVDAQQQAAGDGRARARHAGDHRQALEQADQEIDAVIQLILHGIGGAEDRHLLHPLQRDQKQNAADDQGRRRSTSRRSNSTRLDELVGDSRPITTADGRRPPAPIRAKRCAPPDPCPATGPTSTPQAPGSRALTTARIAPSWIMTI
jgi:hypothetical protein